MYTQAIKSALTTQLAPLETASCCVAFSGGLDSTALLYALAALRAEVTGLQVRAVHINHHLLPQANEWAAHCSSVAAKLDVPLKVVDVNVVQGAGISTEASARDARYRVLEDELQDGELLLTAHHQEDQLETVLLQLLRGAGVTGLSAMPADAPFGRGRHLRPLLDVSRAELEEQVRTSGLTWVEDSSNAALEYDRNYLRHNVIPALRERWPGAAATATRSARHLAEAQSLLDELARIDLASAVEGEALLVSALQVLTPSRARNLLRFWIREHGFRPPSTVKLQEVLRQMLESRPDAHPRVAWEGAEIHRRRGRLYLGGSSS